ncbi:MAG TPA: NAD(P)-binding protein [Candidatus Mediterraneibacter cottocaccae]|nr:NAD(P)-binding protein [Candidatus Mediterraneibacter cottocaccae]
MKKYDYLIVGAGLFGATFAYEMSRLGKKCLVIEKQDHIGGLLYDKTIEGITTNIYGSHVFRTNDKYIWDYLNQFSDFLPNKVEIWKDKENIYEYPFNLKAFTLLRGAITPEEAKKLVFEQCQKYQNASKNSFDIKMHQEYGEDLYHIYKKYICKLWGKDPLLLPYTLPHEAGKITFNYDSVGSCLYEGVPDKGYTPIITKMLENCDILLSTDYLDFHKSHAEIAEKTIFTGRIDEYFGYKFGVLSYNSIHFENEVIQQENIQGTYKICNIDLANKYLYSIEPKHLYNTKSEKTVVTKGYPVTYDPSKLPCYPLNDEISCSILNKYLDETYSEKNVIMAGRLGNYRFYSMEDTIKNALDLAKKENMFHNVNNIRNAKNVIIFGAQAYFMQNIKKMRKGINVQYIYPDGPYESDDLKEFKVLKSISEIEALEEPYILIARGQKDQIEKVSKTFRELHIPFSHLEFFTSEYIHVHYMKALGIEQVTDLDNNIIKIHPQISDKVVIKKENATNCSVILGNIGVQKNLGIQIMGNRAKCEIGNNSTFVETSIVINTEGLVKVGNDCMFSHSITLAQSDQHYIFDLASRKRINNPKEINIGNHVWIGREVELLGGATIGDNSIIGARSVTSGTFPANIIAAGAPARVIRENVIWARDVLKNSNYNSLDECNDQTGLKYLN